MRALEPRERRLLAIGLLVAVLALVWLVVLMPIVDGFAERAGRRRDLLGDYARDERALAQLPSIGRAAAAQRRRAGLFRMAVPDQATAAAMLAERLSVEVQRAGGEMRGVEDLPAPPGAVRARVEAGLSVDQAVALVARLQNTSPLIQVDEADLALHDGVDDARPGPLDVRLEVSAFLTPTATR